MDSCLKNVVFHLCENQATNSLLFSDDSISFYCAKHYDSITKRWLKQAAEDLDCLKAVKGISSDEKM